MKAMKAKTRILVVDDTESVLVSIATILDDGCYDVVTASDGKEAWELLNRGEKFDIIISDYNMPEMNGIGLLLNIRNDPRPIAQTPFILMSGGGQEELEEMCVKYDACFLSKPFSVNGLVALLSDAGSS
ncbi:MAG: response regulator [Candidatus Zambryskibacteria bacterium]|nr:response regulator [Candidatus Zambryskibacteria bacterium]